VQITRSEAADAPIHIDDVAAAMDGEYRIYFFVTELRVAAFFPARARMQTL